MACAGNKGRREGTEGGEVETSGKVYGGLGRVLVRQSCGRTGLPGKRELEWAI